MQQLKTLLAMCTVAIMAFSCTGKYNGFVLKGTYTGGDSTVLHLAYADSTGKYVKDSALVQSGKFEFKGAIKEATMLRMWKGNPDPYSRNEKFFASFFVEPATMKLSLDDADLSKYVLTGSPTNDLSIALNAQQKPLYAQMGELRKKEHASTDDAEKTAIGKELDEISEKIEAINSAFMKNNPNSVVSAYTLRFSLSSLGYREANEIYEAFSDEVKNSSYGKEDFAELQRKLRGEPGQKARLFVRTDINAQELNLPELNKDHYLLIDFWASWCGPCRRGNPHLKEIYKKYNPMGLIIVCVSDDDSNPDKWKEAIAKDGIGEFKHVLRGLKRTADGGYDRSEDLDDDFGVSTLPTKFLVDKNGIIIFKCGSETEALDAKLKEIFGK